VQIAGLGFALTEALLARGWRVFAGQYLPDWPDLVNLTRQYPGMLIPIRLDVTDEGSVQFCRKTVASSSEAVDMLINNAGITSPTSPRSIREELDFTEMKAHL